MTYHDEHAYESHERHVGSNIFELVTVIFAHAAGRGCPWEPKSPRGRMFAMVDAAAHEYPAEWEQTATADKHRIVARVMEARPATNDARG